MSMLAGVALMTAWLGCGWAAEMVKKRGRGYVLPYQALLSFMAVVAAVSILLWDSHTEHIISAGAVLVVVASWLSCAFAAWNDRVNPGVVIFALMQTIMLGVSEIEQAHPTNFWLAIAIAAAWFISGWIVREDRCNPGLLALVLIVSTPLIFRVPY